MAPRASRASRVSLSRSCARVFYKTFVAVEAFFAVFLTDTRTFEVPMHLSLKQVDSQGLCKLSMKKIGPKTPEIVRTDIRTDINYIITITELRTHTSYTHPGTVGWGGFGPPPPLRCNGSPAVLPTPSGSAGRCPTLSGSLGP